MFLLAATKVFVILPAADALNLIATAAAVALLCTLFIFVLSQLEKVQDFLGLPREINRERFVTSEKKKRGFYCLLGKEGKGKGVCLKNNKGRR